MYLDIYNDVAGANSDSLTSIVSNSIKYLQLFIKISFSFHNFQKQEVLLYISIEKLKTTKLLAFENYMKRQ